MTLPTLFQRHKSLNGKDIYTAGDEEEFCNAVFQLSRECVPSQQNILPVNEMQKNVALKIASRAHLYQKMSKTTLLDTFRYIFYKFKKAIFVSIREGKLAIFLPFSNVSFTNEWSDKISVDTSRFKSIEDLLVYVHQQKSDKPVKLNRLHLYIERWYANNGIFRYERPICENDTNINTLREMFENVCKHTTIPDVDFFINKRDFPLMTIDLCEPYFNIFDSYSVKLLSHEYAAYLPILSMCVFDNKSGDIAIPTHNDWVFATEKQNHAFYMTSANDTPVLPWELKKPTAVFRGTNTGIGHDTNTNMRLKVAEMSYRLAPVDPKDNIPLLDAGIVKWNNRIRKVFGVQHLQVVDYEKLGFPLVSKMSAVDIFNHKYLLVIDGHVTAFRLSTYLASDSLVLMQESPWKLWFSDLLVPFVHYVPFKMDLSDLCERILWCKQNDVSVQAIIRKANTFAKQWLTRDAILDQLAFILRQLPSSHHHPSLTLYTFDAKQYLEKDVQTLHASNMVDMMNYYERHPVLQIKCLLGLPKFTVFPTRYPLRIMEYTQQQMLHDNCLKLHSALLTDNVSLAVSGTAEEHITFTLKRIDNDRQLINGFFIGTSIVNKFLRPWSLNWIYTYGRTENKEIIQEHIRGVTLREYILSEDFDFTVFLHITVQIMCALQTAQDKVQFAHMDLCPHNILLERPHPDKQTDAFCLSTTCLSIDIIHYRPVIIDYGYSCEMFSTGTDVATYLCSCLKLMISRRVDANTFRQIITLSNFFHYATKETIPLFSNAKTLRIFVDSEQKFALRTNVARQKRMYGKFTPFDLFTYIIEHTFFKKCFVDKGQSIVHMNRLTTPYYLDVPDRSYANWMNVILKRAQAIALTPCDESIVELREMIDEMKNAKEFKGASLIQDILDTC